MKAAPSTAPQLAASAAAFQLQLPPGTGGAAQSPAERPMALPPDQQAATDHAAGCAEQLQTAGSMEDVWRDILSTHHSTLDFANYTPHGDPDSGAESSGGWSDGGGGGSGSTALGSRNSADLSAYNSADLDAHPSGSGSGVQISELDLLPGGGSSSGGDHLAPGRRRTRDVAKHKARRAAAEIKAAGREVKQALHMSRSFTEYRAIAGESFIDPKKLTKVANLGSGAFAHVEWAVLRQANGEDMNVAVKRLREDLISSDQDLSDFVREGALLKRLNHPSIVKFVGLGFRTDRNSSNVDAVSADSMFIVQQFMNGGTLKLMVLEQMVANHKVVYSFTDALRWMIQLAEGLAYLHSHKPLIIHRDLKLENCLLTDDGNGVLNAKLADFGLHAIVEAAERNETVQRIKRLASSVLSEAAASRALAGLEPSSRLDSLLSVSGPSSARLSREARSAALARSASAGFGPSMRPVAPPMVKRSVSEVGHGSPPGGRPYRPSRLGRRSKDSMAAVNPTVGAADAAVAAVDTFKVDEEPSPAQGRNHGRRNGSSSGGGGGHRRKPPDAPAETAEQRLLRGVGERGSRVWNRLASTLAPRGNAAATARYDMTGQTGSFMYMAPEVMNSKSYNEKVDIFSFGVILLEVFAKSVTGAALLTVGDMEECEMYAWKVAHGYRRPIPTWWPPELGALVVECWAEDPDSRPSAAEVVRRLRDIAPAVDRMDHGSTGCCCMQ